MSIGPDQFAPYKILLEKAKTSKFRALAETLIQTSDEFHRLQKEFPGSIAENRAKRRKKGTPVRYTKRQKEFLVEADQDAVKANADLEQHYRAMSNENALLKAALADEKFDFGTWAWLYDSVHEDDKPLANQIRKLQKKLIDEMEAFLSKLN